MSFKLFAALSALATGAHGFWRMECNGMAGLARIDPLVSPGEISKHVHALFGSRNLGLDSDAADLKSANCTSCAVTQDKSGYWQPVLYFEHADGTLEYVGIKGDTGNGNAGILAYYKLLNDEGTQESNVTAFPEGFRMIAGNSNTRVAPQGLNLYAADAPKETWANYSQAEKSALAIGFNCIEPATGVAEASLARHYLPTVEELRGLGCSGGLRTEIVFPSCWNGNDYNPDDPQAHVAYPSYAEDGYCPEGFDTRLPTLMFEAIWNTNKFVDMEGRFVLSNGDTTGFGMHADFISGWDQATLEAAVKGCHNESGDIRDCSVFNIQAKEDWETCKLDLPDELIDERVKGNQTNPLTSLPGNVDITEPGEELDDPLAVNALPSNAMIDATTESTVEASEPTESPLISSSEPPRQTAEPAVTPVTSSSEAQANGPVETEPPALTDNSEDSQNSIISTEYRTEGNTVYEIIWEEAAVYVTEDLTATVTVSTGPNRMRRDRAKRAHAHYQDRGLHHHHHW